MRQRLVISSVIVSVFFSAGCTRLPPSIADETRACVSWAGTTHFVADNWIKEAVPRGYARRALRAAQQRIERAIEAAENARSEDLRDALYPLQYSTAKVAVAVDQNDWKSANKELRWLLEAKEKLTALQEKSGGTK